MHSESMTADNQVTIVGGRNIGNEYFGAKSTVDCTDLDVLAVGPVAGEVSTMFDRYWNSDWVFPIRAFDRERAINEKALAEARVTFAGIVEEEKADPYVEALRHTPILKQLRFGELTFSWGRAILIYDAPGKVEATEVAAATHLAPALSPFIEKATRELIIISAYFVPSDKLVEFFRQLIEKGVRVRILTNSLASNDVGVVHAGYMRYREALLRAGVELYEFKPAPESRETKQNKKWAGSSQASLHAKTFGLDRRAMFVGSFNLDPRSVALNTEMSVLFESPRLAGAMGGSFDKNIAERAFRLELKTTRAEQSESGY